MEEKLDQLLREFNALNKRLDNIEAQQKELNSMLSSHIKFIEMTYDGLRNPINAAKRFLGGR